MKAIPVASAALALLSGCAAHQPPIPTADGETAAMASDPTTVTIANGDVRGVDEGTVVAFKGIPFAEPPVGNLRWRAPQPIGDWDGIFAATEYANDCMQIPFAADAAPLETAPAEDCLYMNVWKPKGAIAGDDLPVLVWIYGGGWVNGGSSPAVYSGAPTAAKGVVFVSFNYRLGRFGFFAHPALTAANEDDGKLGNYGIMDQVAALGWVQRNIRAFGGNPDKVTVMGESAGGGAVAHLMSGRTAKGLFHGALAMSAPVRRDSTLKPVSADEGPDGEADGLGFARWAGVEGEGPSALEALRALPAQTVVAGIGLAERPVAPASGPMIDGVFLVPADVTFDAGDQIKVPTMAGAVTDDIGWGPDIPLDEFFAQYPDPAAAEAAYRDVEGGRAAVLKQAYQDLLMQEPTRLLVEAQAAAGMPAWHYRYGYVAETMRDEWVGTQHATEIPFFLNTINARYPDALTEDDYAAAEMINDYLVNFVKTRNPNGAGLPEWPRYEVSDPNVMLILPENAAAGPDPWQDRLDVARALSRSRAANAND